MTQLVGELAKRNVTQSQKSSDISGQFQAFRQQIAATSAAAAAVENHNENISIDLLTYDSTGSLSPPTPTAFPPLSLQTVGCIVVPHIGHSQSRADTQRDILQMFSIELL